MLIRWFLRRTTLSLTIFTHLVIETLSIRWLFLYLLRKNRAVFTVLNICTVHVEKVGYLVTSGASQRSPISLGLWVWSLWRCRGACTCQAHLLQALLSLTTSYSCMISCWFSFAGRAGNDLYLSGLCGQNIGTVRMMFHQAPSLPMPLSVAHRDEVAADTLSTWLLSSGGLVCPSDPRAGNQSGERDIAIQWERLGACRGILVVVSCCCRAVLQAERDHWSDVKLLAFITQTCINCSSSSHFTQLLRLKPRCCCYYCCCCT